MAKKKNVFICQSCSYQASQWVGQCPNCQEWNSLSEEAQQLPQHKKVSSRNSAEPKSITEVRWEQMPRILTGVGEFDRVMGGGLTPGSLTLIGGEPGIGKSTLLLNVCGQLAEKLKQGKILYVSGEESQSQIARRAQRLGINPENLYLFNETNWQEIDYQLKKLKPEFFVLDSVQTASSSEIASPPGTLSQIREITYQMMNYAKGLNVTCFIIGHVTKEGNIAGPKVLEHMVDTVIYFEGDQFGGYRLLRAIKNRFGNTNEVGIFEMREQGLVEVSNPSEFFLDEPIEGAFGRSLTCIMEGSRPLFVEIQALVVENKFAAGRRTTQGLETNRLAMMVAIIEKYLSLPLGLNDIYLNVVGGLRLKSRDSDLSIIASLMSSFRAKPLNPSWIFLGEVGLTGEVRSVPFAESRLKEIEQMGYETVITSKKIVDDFQSKFKLKLKGIKKVQELEEILFI